MKITLITNVPSFMGIFRGGGVSSPLHNQPTTNHNIITRTKSCLVKLNIVLRAAPSSSFSDAAYSVKERCPFKIKNTDCAHCPPLLPAADCRLVGAEAGRRPEARPDDDARPVRHPRGPPTAEVPRPGGHHPDDVSRGGRALALQRARARPPATDGVRLHPHRTLRGRQTVLRATLSRCALFLLLFIKIYLLRGETIGNRCSTMWPCSYRQSY